MKIWVGIGGLLGGLSIMLGAFGAHSLKNQLPPEKFAAFQTATYYMSVHAMALLLVGVLSLHLGETYESRLKKVQFFFINGILMFCGSIYVLTFGGPKLFGPITPLGGLSFMIGWFNIAWIFLKKN